jgi:alkylation response protein AidB-like acyl-CoA dehydrogenase
MGVAAAKYLAKEVGFTAVVAARRTHGGWAYG